MKISEIEKKIDLFSLIGEKYNLSNIGKETYRVNPCPVCNSHDHFTVYPKTNSFSSYSDCCKGGSVYQYLLNVEGLDEETAYKKLCELAEVTPVQKKIEKKANGIDPMAIKKNNLSEFIIQLYTNQAVEDKRYFVERSLSLDVMDKFYISVYQDIDGKRAMLPILENGRVISYVTRALEGQEPKYKNMKGESVFFNSGVIKQVHNDVIFITEGIFDALTLESRGYNAIALNGVNNANTGIDRLLKMNQNNNIFITAFDNDEAGQTATEKARLKSLSIPKEYNDINEWGVEEGKKNINIDENINEQIKMMKQPDNLTKFLNDKFHQEIDEMKDFQYRKTGFKNLDKELKGLYPGLFVLGGISSVGKTTFAHHLADNLAKSDEHVIFFSLEQSTLEMVSKSIARETALNNINNAYSSRSIRIGEKNEQINKAIETYKNISDRVNIVEGNFNTDVITIRNYVEQYIQFNQVKPVVFVDYLQIIPALDERMSDKQRVDKNVTELKRLSRDLNISLFVISSLNRGNYLTPIDFESFKESGGIEYSADVVIGLQLEAINDEIFNMNHKIKEKRDKIKEAKNEYPRQIELVCLKNRNGKPNFSCSFSYWSNYDLYEPNNTGKSAEIQTKKDEMLVI